MKTTDVTVIMMGDFNYHNGIEIPVDGKNITGTDGWIDNLMKNTDTDPEDRKDFLKNQKTLSTSLHGDVRFAKVKDTADRRIDYYFFGTDDDDVINGILAKEKIDIDENATNESIGRLPLFESFINTNKNTVNESIVNNVNEAGGYSMSPADRKFIDKFLSLQLSVDDSASGMHVVDEEECTLGSIGLKGYSMLAEIKIDPKDPSGKHTVYIGTTYGNVSQTITNYIAKQAKALGLIIKIGELKGK